MARAPAGNAAPVHRQLSIPVCTEAPPPLRRIHSSDCFSHLLRASATGRRGPRPMFSLSREQSRTIPEFAEGCRAMPRQENLHEYECRRHRRLLVLVDSRGRQHQRGRLVLQSGRSESAEQSEPVLRTFRALRPASMAAFCLSDQQARIIIPHSRTTTNRPKYATTLSSPSARAGSRHCKNTASGKFG